MSRSGATVRFNCVDKSLLALDCSKARMVFHLILTVEGQVDVPRLSQALISVLRRHPGMRATVCRGRFRCFRRVREPCENETLNVLDLGESRKPDNLDCVDVDSRYEECLYEWMNRPLDIEREFPLRVLLLRRSASECTLVFTFHHTSADGLRALGFVREVVESYNGEIRGDTQSADDPRMFQRGDELFQLAQAQRPRVRHYYLKIVSSLFHRFFVAPFSPPARIVHDRSGDSEDIYFCSATLKPAELGRIKAEAESVGVSVNDFLVAACFGAVEKWNASCGRRCNRISVMVPVDTRPKGYRRVVSNQVSFISVSTRPRDRVEAAVLLRNVSTKIKHAARQRTAFGIIYFVYACSRLPLPIMTSIARFFILTRVYLDTVLLTNVGVIWPRASGADGGESRMGNARIVDFRATAPVVTPMGMSLYTGTYNERVGITLAYKTALFSRNKAETFMSRYLDEIKG